jgi:hypothetical protein
VIPAPGKGFVVYFEMNSETNEEDRLMSDINPSGRTIRLTSLSSCAG